MMAADAETLEHLEQLGAGSHFQQELCSQLGDCPMFGDLDWGEVQLLARFVKAYRAPAGTVIFREGDPGSYMALVLDGKVEITKEDAHEVAKTVATVGRGKALGEMAVIDGERRSATCTALQETDLAVLTRGNFEKLLADYPPLAGKILLKMARLLSQRLRHACGLLVDYLDE